MITWAELAVFRHDTLLFLFYCTLRSYTSSVAGEREEKRGKIHKTNSSFARLSRPYAAAPWVRFAALLPKHKDILIELVAPLSFPMREGR
jgi:hypothetical protein